MAYLEDGYYGDSMTAARAIPSERAAFIQKTYMHLAVAILAFAGLEAALIKSGVGDSIVRALFTGGNLGMFLLMAAFIGCGYAARYMARQSASIGSQYAGLALYVVIQAIIFLPLLIVADRYFQGQNLILKAGLLTMGMFLGLTVAVFVTKADFSWLRTALIVCSWVALATILAGWIFGFTLGLWFSALMIVMASAFIVYDTSNILHHYPTDMYVGAALELFASVALLFYYILRFAMQQGSRD